MSAPIFFKRGQGLTVREIAALTGAKPRAGADLDRRVTGVAAIDRATPTDLVFLDNAKYAGEAAACDAGACLTSERFTAKVPAQIGVLIAPEPYRAFVETAQALYPDALRPSSLFEASGAAAGAFVHPTARLESGVTIDPGAVIGPRAEIGTGTVIGAGAVIGPNVCIGRNCSIGANVSIKHALVGDRVIVHPGACLGQDGFGYVGGPGGHRKVPQVGRVIIQDDVEIGAGTAIDRGAIRDTVIGEGTKIDNLVQIGHNCSIGRHCIIVAQCGISGSVVVEDHVMLAGRVGIGDNLTIGEGAMVAAGSGVPSDIPAGEQWAGYPAMRHPEYYRMILALRRWVAEDKESRGRGGKPDDKSARRRNARRDK